MIVQIEISKAVNSFVKNIYSGNYQQAYNDLMIIKSDLAILKTTFGRKQDYEKLDEIIEMMEGLIITGMDVSDLVEEMLEEMNKIPISP